MHHPLALGGLGRVLDLVGRAGGKVQSGHEARGIAHAALHDGAHQLRERRRAVAGTADRGRQRGRQRGEGVTETLPLPVQFLKGLDLQQVEDAPVLRAPAAGLHQPAVDFLAHLGAGRQHFVARRVRVLLQVVDKPQLQRMHAREVAAIIEVELLRRVTLEQRLPTLCRELFVRHVAREPGREILRLHSRPHRAQRHHHRARRHAHAVEQRAQRHVAALAVVLLVEAAQVHAALAVGEALEVLPAPRIGGVLQQPSGGRGRAVHVVIHHLAHHADEHQVHRTAQRLGHRHHGVVVAALEVAEAVRAAAGIEGLPGGSGIAALHRSRQRIRKAGAGVGPEVIQHPGTQAVARVELGARARQVRRGHAALVDFGNELQPAHQGTQLGGGAEVELGAGIDVERLVEVVGIDAQVVHALPALVERQAVDHLGRVAGAQQPRAGEPQFPDARRIGQPAQEGGDLLLHGGVERGARREIEAVQLIEAAHAEQREQLRAREVHTLLAREVDHRRGAGARAQHQRRRLRRRCQVARDHAIARHAPQVAVGERRQRRGVAQVVGRAAHRENQREHLLVILRPLGERRRRIREHAIDLREGAAEPGFQPVAEARHLAVARLCGQRQRVQVIEQQLPARGQRVLAAAVDTQAGRAHLQQLVARIARDALGRMTELLELRGQRAGADDFLLAPERLQRLLPHGHAKTFPVDHGIHGRARGIEQLAVLDVEQRARDQLGNRGEIGVDVARVARLLHHRAVQVEQPEARLALLGVDIEEVPGGEFAHAARGHGLALDGKARLLQPGCQFRQGGVTEADVVGATIGAQRRARRPRPELERNAAGKGREPARLQRRVADLVLGDVAEREHGAQHDHPDRDAHGRRNDAFPQRRPALRAARRRCLRARIAGREQQAAVIHGRDMAEDAAARDHREDLRGKRDLLEV